MHELTLVNGILSIAADESEKQGFKRVLEISLKIGELSGVIPRCMEEFFPLASKGTVAEGAKLVMEEIPAEFQCTECNWRGGMQRGLYKCPSCASSAIKLLSGREFYVENLKVE